MEKVPTNFSSKWFDVGEEVKYDERFYGKFKCDDRGRIVVKSQKDIDKIIRVQKHAERFPKISLKTKDASYFFHNLFELKGIEELEMKEVVKADGLFKGCKKLEDIRRLNTPNLISAKEMFENCFSLISSPLARVEKIKNMDSMYKNCKRMKTLNAAVFSSVKTMKDTFYGCERLKSLEYIESFEDVRVTVDTFKDCESFDANTLKWITYKDNIFDYLYDISIEGYEKTDRDKIIKSIEKKYVDSDRIQSFKEAYSGFIDKIKHIKKKVSDAKNGKNRGIDNFSIDIEQDVIDNSKKIGRTDTIRKGIRTKEREEENKRREEAAKHKERRKKNEEEKAKIADLEKIFQKNLRKAEEEIEKIKDMIDIEIEKDKRRFVKDNEKDFYRKKNKGMDYENRYSEERSLWDDRPEKKKKRSGNDEDLIEKLDGFLPFLEDVARGDITQNTKKMAAKFKKDFKESL